MYTLFHMISSATLGNSHHFSILQMMELKLRGEGVCLSPVAERRPTWLYTHHSRLLTWLIEILGAFLR